MICATKEIRGVVWMVKFKLSWNSVNAPWSGALRLNRKSLPPRTKNDSASHLSPFQKYCSLILLFWEIDSSTNTQFCTNSWTQIPRFPWGRYTATLGIKLWFLLHFPPSHTLLQCSCPCSKWTHAVVQEQEQGDCKDCMQANALFQVIAQELPRRCQGAGHLVFQWGFHLAPPCGGKVVWSQPFLSCRVKGQKEQEACF